MISAVAEMYGIHPQTLRLYEREGLLRPSRSDGNTRLYTQDDLERLETILNLTRELGVNLAGIEIILNMREKMGDMQREMQSFVEYVQRELLARGRATSARIENALVPVPRARVLRTKGSQKVNGLSLSFSQSLSRSSCAGGIGPRYTDHKTLGNRLRFPSCNLFAQSAKAPAGGPSSRTACGGYGAVNATRTTVRDV